MNPKINRRFRKEKKRKQDKRIVLKSTSFLLNQASLLRIKNPELAKEYYQSAKKIGMRTRFHLPSEKTLLFCPHCGSAYTIDTVRIRINSKKKHINYKCLKCNKLKKKGF